MQYLQCAPSHVSRPRQDESVDVRGTNTWQPIPLPSGPPGVNDGGALDSGRTGARGLPCALKPETASTTEGHKVWLVVEST